METYMLAGRMFSVYWDDPTTIWPTVPGVYAFAARQPAALLQPPGWSILYVGQTKTDSLAGRLGGNHEKREEARRWGATHILLWTESSPDARDALEDYLRKQENPPLNLQGNLSPTEVAGALAALQRMRDTKI